MQTYTVIVTRDSTGESQKMYVNGREWGIRGFGSNSRDMGRTRYAFAKLWNDLNAARGYPWSGNWWVWRLEYDNPKCTEATCRSK